MTGRIGLPPHIQELAVAKVTETALLLAEDKNVPVSGELCSLFARSVVELLDVLSIQRIARSDIKAWASAAASINRLLDVYAATEVLYLMRILEGHSYPDRGHMIAEAEVWMREALANDKSDRRLRWPDLLDMAKSHLRARASGPVSILFPNMSGMRIGYLLDLDTSSRKLVDGQGGHGNTAFGTVPIDRPEAGRRFLLKQGDDMNAFPNTYELDVTLASLSPRLADQRRTAQASVRAVAGIRVRNATLAAVIEGVSGALGSGEGP